MMDELGDEAPDEVEIADLRHLLYGLHAIMTLHTAQEEDEEEEEEEEGYLSLGDDFQMVG